MLLLALLVVQGEVAVVVGLVRRHVSVLQLAIEY
jgi:hypothetical protein